MTSSSRTYAFFLAGACIWCLLILVPIAQVFHSPFIASVAGTVDRVFAAVCHQIDARSFHVWGIRLAVCGRCTSIYFGFLAGILVWKIAARTPPPTYIYWWCVALVPMLVDVFLESAGIQSGGIVTRAVTGGWFGIIAGVIIAPIFIEAWTDLTSGIHHHPSRAYESTTE